MNFWFGLILGWIVISIFTLGAYTLFVWFRKKNVNHYRDIAYQNLHDAIEDGQISLAPHLCLSCAHLISESDKIPYCTRCFQRLERKGFFDDEEIYHV